jgi:ADP-ribose pyrophosphatase
VHLYCATVDARQVAGCHGLAHEGEDIRPLVMARADALAMPGTRPLSLWAGVALAWLAGRGGAVQSGQVESAPFPQTGIP